MTREETLPSVLVPVFCLVCAGIVYGSLFPFHFHLHLDSHLIAHFLGSWRTINSPGDTLGNLALFFPYGYMARLIAVRTLRPGRSALLFCLAGISLAVACQTAQLFTPGRDPSIFDLYMNGLGMALGWTGARLLPLGSSGTLLGGNPSHHLSLVIGGAWLACQLLPFVPSMDIKVWKDSLYPLLVEPHFRWQECLMRAVSWLMFFHLMHFRAGLRCGAAIVLVGSLGLLLLQVVIVRNALDLSEVLGLAAGAGVWLLWGSRLPGRLIAWALLAAFAINVVAPLVLWPAPRDFGWLPFGGYLSGSMLINAIALCRKVFVFGAISLLLLESRPDAMHRALGIAAFLLLLEILQRWVGYGTPALTDPLLFLALAWLIQRQMARYRSAYCD